MHLARYSHPNAHEGVEVIRLKFSSGLLVFVTCGSYFCIAGIEFLKPNPHIFSGRPAEALRHMVSFRGFGPLSLRSVGAPSFHGASAHGTIWVPGRLAVLQIHGTRHA